jgi:hypothetical protein
MSKKKHGAGIFPQETKVALGRQVSGDDGRPAKGVQAAMLRVLGVQRPLVLAYVKRLRAKRPGASAEVLIAVAERDFLRAVTGTGAAGGATAVIPGIGTAAALGVSAGVTVAFLEASALYAQTVAELHGVAVRDPEQAKLLVMAVILGDEAAGLLSGVSEQIVDGSTGPWGAAVSTLGGQGGTWSMVGKELQSRFLRRFAASQTAGAMGRALPFGIGAAVGGVSSRVLGRRVVVSTRRAFASLETLDAREIGAAVAQAPTDAAQLRALVAAERAAAGDVERAIEQERERRAS